MSLFENRKTQLSGQKKFIKDFQVGERVDTYSKVLSIAKRTKKDGGGFLTLEFMDKTGKINAKIWDNAEYYFKYIQEGVVYRIGGVITEYNGQKEVKIETLRAVSASDKTDNGYDESDYIEKPAFDTADTFKEMMALLKKNVSSPHLLQLIDLFAIEYGEKFQVHYGAQKIHHSYVGGLLQHTYSIIKLAVFCAEHYSLDKELLLMGALFHDIGKISEFNVNPALEVTVEGGLLGHLVIGNMKFIELKNKITGFPEELSVKIQHLIISHHGEKEFGSPEIPKIPEAYMLHILDLLDSKLKIFEETVASSENKGLFSEYVQVLGRRVYNPPKS